MGSKQKNAISYDYKDVANDKIQEAFILIQQAIDAVKESNQHLVKYMDNKTIVLDELNIKKETAKKEIEATKTELMANNKLLNELNKFVSDDGAI